MSNQRLVFLLTAIVTGVPVAAHAQAPMTHHHPRGAKIIMIGTLVDPVCAYALAVADSAESHCVGEHWAGHAQPVLRADRQLYLLGLDSTRASKLGDIHSLLGKRVKVDGTVYPAGTSYLIVVDSIRVLAP